MSLLLTSKAFHSCRAAGLPLFCFAAAATVLTVAQHEMSQLFPNVDTVVENARRQIQSHHVHAFQFQLRLGKGKKSNKKNNGGTHGETQQKAEKQQQQQSQKLTKFKESIGGCSDLAALEALYEEKMAAAFGGTASPADAANAEKEMGMLGDRIEEIKKSFNDNLGTFQEFEMQQLDSQMEEQIPMKERKDLEEKLQNENEDRQRVKFEKQVKFEKLLNEGGLSSLQKALKALHGTMQLEESPEELELLFEQMTKLEAQIKKLEDQEKQEQEKVSGIMDGMNHNIGSKLNVVIAVEEGSEEGNLRGRNLNVEVDTSQNFKDGQNFKDENNFDDLNKKMGMLKVGEDAQNIDAQNVDSQNAQLQNAFYEEEEKKQQPEEKSWDQTEETFEDQVINSNYSQQQIRGPQFEQPQLHQAQSQFSQMQPQTVQPRQVDWNAKLRELKTQLEAHCDPQNEEAVLSSEDEEKVMAYFARSAHLHAEIEKAEKEVQTAAAAQKMEKSFSFQSLAPGRLLQPEQQIEIDSKEINSQSSIIQRREIDQHPYNNIRAHDNMRAHDQYYSGLKSKPAQQRFQPHGITERYDRINKEIESDINLEHYRSLQGNASEKEALKEVRYIQYQEKRLRELELKEEAERVEQERIKTTDNALLREAKELGKKKLKEEQMQKDAVIAIKESAFEGCEELTEEERAEKQMKKEDKERKKQLKREKLKLEVAERKKREQEAQEAQMNRMNQEIEINKRIQGMQMGEIYEKSNNMQPFHMQPFPRVPDHPQPFFQPSKMPDSSKPGQKIGQNWNMDHADYKKLAARVMRSEGQGHRQSQEGRGQPGQRVAPQPKSEEQHMGIRGRNQMHGKKNDNVKNTPEVRAATNFDELYFGEESESGFGEGSQFGTESKPRKIQPKKKDTTIIPSTFEDVFGDRHEKSQKSVNDSKEAVGRSILPSPRINNGENNTYGNNMQMLPKNTNVRVNNTNTTPGGPSTATPGGPSGITPGAPGSEKSPFQLSNIHSINIKKQHFSQNLNAYQQRSSSPNESDNESDSNSPKGISMFIGSKISGSKGGSKGGSNFKSGNNEVVEFMYQPKGSQQKSSLNHQKSSLNHQKSSSQQHSSSQQQPSSSSNETVNETVNEPVDMYQGNMIGITSHQPKITSLDAGQKAKALAAVPFNPLIGQNFYHIASGAHLDEPRALVEVVFEVQITKHFQDESDAIFETKMAILKMHPSAFNGLQEVANPDGKDSKLYTEIIPSPRNGIQQIASRDSEERKREERHNFPLKPLRFQERIFAGGSGKTNHKNHNDKKRREEAKKEGKQEEGAAQLHGLWNWQDPRMKVLPLEKDHDRKDDDRKGGDHNDDLSIFSSQSLPFGQNNPGVPLLLFKDLFSAKPDLFDASIISRALLDYEKRTHSDILGTGERVSSAAYDVVLKNAYYYIMTLQAIMGPTTHTQCQETHQEDTQIQSKAQKEKDDKMDAQVQVDWSDSALFQDMEVASEATVFKEYSILDDLTGDRMPQSELLIHQSKSTTDPKHHPYGSWAGFARVKVLVSLDKVGRPSLADRKNNGVPIAGC